MEDNERSNSDFLLFLVFHSDFLFQTVFCFILENKNNKTRTKYFTF